ncbi:MAG TPA: Ig-like domain-containing protein [Candidatus Sulfotelmatobacter sp.]|nr:Ig-like domain-containing protein [Candidatus Sulfotelmatobacter sp.]
MSFARKCAALTIAIAAIAFAPLARAQETKPTETPKPAEAPKPASIEVTPNGTEVHVGDKVQFKAVAKDASGKVLDVKPDVWFAAPFDVAGADDKGVVVFHQPGAVTVGVVIADKPGFAHVTVVTPPVAKIDIAPMSTALAAGSSTLMIATARSSNGDPRTDVPIQWKSSSPAIAKVDAAGMVTGVAPGTAKLQATAGPAGAEISVRVVADSVQSLAVLPADTNAKTGDVVHFTATAKGAKSATVKGVLISWSVSGPGASIYPDGGFVAMRPGTYLVKASIGRHDAVASVTVAPRNAERALEVVAHIPSKSPTDGSVLQTSEEWIVGHHLYVSTIADRVYSYDISDPANPKALDSMKVDARLINDVSITPDEKVGVFTREGASNRKNGIVFFDASDPAHLKVLSEYTETVTGGVHSAFINTHYVYITDDATGSLRIIDFQDPAHPKEVARWQTENATAQTVVGPLGPSETGRYLHDLYVKDGLAYLAYWRDGMIILDVGNGIKGGSPEHPQLVSQFKYNHYELYGNGWLAGTHTAFRYKNYAFIGDEVFPAMFDIGSKERVPVRGICHVMDVSDIEHPREVAYYEVPEGGVHNVWADDDMLVLGDYAGGGRVVDISGELRGNLYAQGREIARLWTGDPDGFRPNVQWAWGAQPANGLIFFNDINSGIWIAKLGKPKFKGLTTAPPLQEKQAAQ